MNILNTVDKAILLCFLVVFASCRDASIPQGNSNTKTPPTKTIQKMTTTRNIHGAKTQMYRWYQLYEREMTDERVRNQLDMFVEEVEIKSASGELKGRENYPPMLKAYDGWKNAHHVQNFDVVTYEDGSIGIAADIIYQGIKPDESVNSFKVSYSGTNLKYAEENKLPQFTNVNITVSGKVDSVYYEDTYLNNRVLSLLHAWLFHVEGQDKDVNDFLELLTDDFYLNFSEQTQLDSKEKLEEWLKVASTTVKVSNHTPENVVVEKTGDHTYLLNVDLVWSGIAANDAKMRAKTHHTWQISDDVNERFARIKRADVTQLEPFEVYE